MLLHPAAVIAHKQLILGIETSSAIGGMALHGNTTDNPHSLASNGETAQFATECKVRDEICVLAASASFIS